MELPIVSSWFNVSTEIILRYISSYGIVRYMIPMVLKVLGFGPGGIVLHSVAAWIQSKFGTSYVFSLLQSIGARGGISNPNLWSFIGGLAHNLCKPVKHWYSGLFPVPLVDTSKSEQSDQDGSTLKFYSPILTFVFIFGMGVILRCIRRQDNFEQMDHNNIIPINGPTAEVEQELRPRISETPDRRHPKKVTEILRRNPNGNYICPRCKKGFKPQGITRHVKSCDRDWCRSNQIHIN